MTVYDVEKRGAGRAILHFALGSEWVRREGRKWVMRSRYYGDRTFPRLPREGDTI